MFGKAGRTLAKVLAAALVMAAVSLTNVAVDAQQRAVMVNGQMMTPEELYILDRLSGGYVPNGSYWLDPYTGIWGYAGDPTPRGRLGAGSGSNGGGAAANYSGDLDRGPFGTYMSDGNCSFVNGVPVGNC